MKLRQIEFVLAIADTGSFREAARKCHATQPTLSSALAQLEEELGGKLFDRTTRRTEITPFGSHLLPSLRALIQTRDEISEAAHSFHNPDHQLLRIGFSPLVDMSLLNRVLLPFRDAHPEINFFFKECLLDDLEARMRDGTVDISIVPKPSVPDGFDTFAFCDSPLFYLPQDGTPAPPAPLQLNAIPDNPLILTGGACGLNKSVEDLFAGVADQPPTYPGQAVTYQVIEEWSELGIGAGLLPGAKISPTNRRAVPLVTESGRPAVFAYSWVWSEKDSRNSALSDLLTYVRSEAAQPSKGQAA